MTPKKLTPKTRSQQIFGVRKKNNINDIWGRQAPNVGLLKNVSEISVGPQKRPSGQKFLLRRAFLDPKIWIKFYSQNHPEAKMGSKKRAGVPKTSFALIFAIFFIFEICRNFYHSGRFFEIFELWTFFFEKIEIFKSLQV